MQLDPSVPDPMTAWRVAYANLAKSATPATTCDHCGKRGAKLRCGKCKKVTYCARDCQAKGWKTHKFACRDK